MKPLTYQTINPSGKRSNNQASTHTSSRRIIMAHQLGALHEVVKHLPERFNQDSPRKMAAVGLANIPNQLCYQNSVLQVLFHYARFAHWLDSSHHQKRGLCAKGHGHIRCVPEPGKTSCGLCCKIQSCLLCRLKLMLDQYWTTKKKIDYSAFRLYRQQMRLLALEPSDEVAGRRQFTDLTNDILSGQRGMSRDIPFRLATNAIAHMCDGPDANFLRHRNF